jgi:ABC-type glycerol-3-phosphate transport system permease component
MRYGAYAQRCARLLRQTGTYTILLLLVVLTVFPLVWMLLTSLKGPRDIFDGPLLPASLSLSSYQRVWNGLDFPRHFGNSAFVTVMTVAVVVVAGTPAGYAFARLRFPGREWAFFLFLGCMTIPTAAILVPMFIFLNQLDLLNTLHGLSLAYLGGSLPFAIFLMRAFFTTIPGELADAGKIDGCGELGVFARIFLPLARPGLATIVIVQSVNTWNEFMFATTLVTTPELTTLQTSLYRYEGNWIALSAGMVMAILPMVVVYVVLQRQFIRGLGAGALRG